MKPELTTLRAELEELQPQLEKTQLKEAIGMNETKTPTNEPKLTKEELLAKRSEVKREVLKVKKQLDTEISMLFPTFRDRIERKLNRLGGELLLIDKMLNEHSGQTTLF